MPDLISLEEAKAKGLARYFTGIPCKRGHVCERWVSGHHCIKCAPFRDARKRHDRAGYRLENLDACRRRTREYGRRARAALRACRELGINI